MRDTSKLVRVRVSNINTHPVNLTLRQLRAFVAECDDMSDDASVLVTMLNEYANRSLALEVFDETEAMRNEVLPLDMIEHDDTLLRLADRARKLATSVSLIKTYV